MEGPAFNYIELLNDPSLVVCKQCQHAIWPKEVSRHFHDAEHDLSRETVGQIVTTVEELPGLTQDSTQLNVPVAVERAFTSLRLRRDGLLCQIEPARCHYVCTTEDVMRKHLRQVHRASRYRRKGRPTKRQQKRQETAGDPVSWISVVCQRFFPSRQGSRYFQVRRSDEGRPRTADRIVPVWNQAVQIMGEKVKQAAAEQQRVIAEGSAREVNQWLERAGWHKYLVGLEVDKLLDCVAEPDEETERELWMIWRGMDDMVQECQKTVVERAGLHLRFEAVRTEQQQTRYTPLQGYMDRKAVVKHARPWKQILMFIGRTREEREWRKPKYKLKKEQKKAWKHLWRAAGSAYMRTQEVLDKESDEDGGEGPAQDERPPNALSQACLTFCFTLLRKQYVQTEYDNVLICGLAVLGVRASGGWTGADGYPPILSKMIKIARFMVIEQTFRERGPDISDSSSDDRSSESNTDSEPEDQDRPDCLTLVRKYMNEFMIRGTNGAMQWMLNLRTYGLKIHYNTTAEGSIDWVGEQIS